MRKLRHPVAAFILFSLLTTLLVNIYDGLADGYGIVREDVKGGGDIMQRLSDLNLIQGINEISTGIQNLKSPANPLDIVGALSAAAIGVLQTAGGIVVFPIEIFGILTDFYFIPPIVTTALGAMIVVYVGFIIVSAYQRWDV